MLLWLMFALTTVAVLAAILRPLTRPTDVSQADAKPAPAADIAVYKDQLTEIDADAARGLIDGAEAEAARREVARRLLARAGADATGAAVRGPDVRTLLLAVAGLVPVAAILGYLALGSPLLPARPAIASRSVPLDKAPVNDLITAVEARLRTNPSDGQGWDVIAPVYFRLERFDDAAEAYAQAARLLGETTARLAGFAEATVLANNGIVTEPARLAYEKIRAQDPTRIEPRFWLALAKEQDGRKAEAAAEYKTLLASAPADAPWRPLVVERLQAVEPAAAPPPVSQIPRGPSAADMKAAEQMSDRDRGQMIAGMVAGLAKRLEGNPQDPQGWTRLIQAYAVLDEKAKAAKALADARRHLAGNASALSELTALAKTLGISGSAP